MQSFCSGLSLVGLLRMQYPYELPHSLQHFFLAEKTRVVFFSFLIFLCCCIIFLGFFFPLLPLLLPFELSELHLLGSCSTHFSGVYRIHPTSCQDPTVLGWIWAGVQEAKSSLLTLSTLPRCSFSVLPLFLCFTKVTNFK